MGQSADMMALEQGFRIGDWHVRPPAGELSRARRFGWVTGADATPARHVEPKAMRVLLALARHPGNFVSKDELIQEVWDGRPVTDDVLTGAIHALRSAMDDDARDPRYIETRSNVGYRLLPLVTPRRRVSRRWLAASAFGLVVLAVVVVAVQTGRHATQPVPAGAAEPIATIAVLPFLDLSEAGDSEYLSVAMTEALILNLSRVRDLRVISRTSVMPYADYRGSAATLARELGADLLVEGSVQAVDGEVRVVAQLIDPYDDRHLWADDFDRSLDNVLALQQDIAEAVAVQIGAVVAEPSRVPMLVLPAAQMHNYLNARYQLARSGVAATEAALTGFRELAEENPEFAPAHLGVAEALLYLFKQHARDRDSLDAALESAARFESLSGPTAESHRCIGQLLLLSDWDFEAAGKRYRSAILLNPSDTVARSRHAWLLVALQEFEAAALEIQQIRLLDPLYYDSPEMANLLLYAGQVEEAVAEFERLDRTTSLDKVVLRAMAVAYLAAGQDDAAKEVLVRILMQDGTIGTDDVRRLLALPPDAVYRAILEAQPFRSPIVTAGFHHLLGDTERAIGQLRRAVAERDQHVIYLGALPEFASLHEHPEFQALLSEIGVTPNEQSHLRETRLASAFSSNPQAVRQEN